MSQEHPTRRFHDIPFTGYSLATLPDVIDRARAALSLLSGYAGVAPATTSLASAIACIEATNKEGALPTESTQIGQFVDASALIADFFHLATVLESTADATIAAELRPALVAALTVPPSLLQF